MFSMGKDKKLIRQKHEKGLMARVALSFQNGKKGGVFTKSRRGKRGVILF